MAEKAILDALKFLERCLIEGGLDISKIILFGSQARRNASDESDVDVAIISEDFRGRDIFDRAMLTR